MNARVLITLPNALAWADDAACRGLDPDAFFTDSTRGVEWAKAVCARCPVREQCLDQAYRAEDTSRYGIYGGLTPAERAQLARPR
jgi:WhiB family redox-sensing transcriptional regulator